MSVCACVHVCVYVCICVCVCACIRAVAVLRAASLAFLVPAFSVLFLMEVSCAMWAASTMNLGLRRRHIPMYLYCTVRCNCTVLWSLWQGAHTYSSPQLYSSLHMYSSLQLYSAVVAVSILYSSLKWYSSLQLYSAAQKRKYAIGALRVRWFCLVDASRIAACMCARA